MSERISRRTFIQGSAAAIGAVAGVAALGKPAFAGLKPSATEATKTDGRDLALRELVAPIAVGSRLGHTTVAGIGVDSRGLGVVTLADETGRRWDAEIARRDDQDSALRPLAVSKHYSLFLRNSGSGSLPTDERLGLAVLAIGERVRINEDAVASAGFASRSEVWASTGFRPAAKA